MPAKIDPLRFEAISTLPDCLIIVIASVSEAIFILHIVNNEIAAAAFSDLAMTDKGIVTQSVCRNVMPGQHIQWLCGTHPVSRDQIPSVTFRYRFR